MHDWHRFVRGRFPANRLRREREEEIIADLAQQLADCYEEALAGGASEEEAAEHARSQIPDWAALAHSIEGSLAGSRQPAIDRWHDQAQTAALARESKERYPARLLAELKHDLLHGIRILLKNPGFAVIAIITLALGIGVNTAVFSVVNAILGTPRQYPDFESIVYLWGTRIPDSLTTGIAAADAFDWQTRSSSFSEFSVFRSGTKTWRGAADAERVRSLETTSSLFALLGVKPVLGRLFSPGADSAGAPAVVVSDHFWRTKLGADPGIIGKTCMLDGVYHTIIGVIEPTRKLMQLTDFDADVLTLLSLDAANLRRGERSYQALARLQPGVPMKRAQTELDGIAAGLAQSFPETNEKVGVRLESLTDRLVRPLDRLMGLVLIVAVSAVLLIACMNLANMLLAKATSRAREFAVRLALGAGRMRVIRQLIAESMLLALSGGALGFWLAHGAVRIFLQSIEDAPFTLQDVGPNMSVLLYTLGLSLATSVVFGLAPAALLRNISLADAMKEAGATGGAGLSRSRLRQGLAVAELAVGLPFLVCCGLAVRNMQGLSAIDLGFEPRNLITMYIEMPKYRYPDNTQLIAAFQEIIKRMQSLPGARAAGATLSFPVGGMHFRLIARARVEGSPQPGSDSAEYLPFTPITPGYFEAMGIPLLSGRVFGAQDLAGSIPVAMINRRMATSRFQNLDAVGRRLTLDPGTKDERQVTIVGVVGDSGRGIFGEPSAPELYLPHAQSPTPAMVVVVRAKGDPIQLVPELRRCVRGLDPEIPIAEVQTVPEIVRRWLRDDRALALFLAILAALSIALAGLGLYGVMSYAVNRRTHEIGVRVALGADASKIVRLVLCQCLGLCLKGLGIGYLISLPVALLLGSQFYGVSQVDPVTFMGVALFMLAIGLLAGYLPARRATRVDPIQALRHE